MKSYNHLWEELISYDNIWLAIDNAANGNMKRKLLKKMGRDPDAYIDKVRKWIIEFEPIKHEPKIINDGISAKKRAIVVPTVREHIVQHAIVNILKPIFMKGMYEHSYASIPGRGCHAGMKTIKKWIQHDPSNVKYCLKLDIQKYFDSIPHDVLLAKLQRIIHDEEFLSLLEKVISTIETGLPLGFYLSQWLANWYLSELDHYIKEVLGVPHYIRYQDDMVLFGSNKRKLHQIKVEIENYLKYNLELTLKHNWQLFRFHTKKDKGRFLDFMGFRFYRNRVTLRRKIALKAMRKARRIHKKGRATVHDARQMMTYKGWIRATDTYTWFQTYIKPYVKFQDMRRKIAKHDKRRANKHVVSNRIQCKA